MAYIGQTLTEGTRRAHTFTATAGQTTFNAVYGVGSVDVYQNGILLQPADYTATTGTTVVLGVGAAVNDEITIIAHNTFSVADTVSSSQGGTFAGNVSMSGTLGVTGAVTASNGLTVDDDGATPLTVDRATSNGAIIDVQKDGTSVGSIGNDGNDFYVTGSAANIAGIYLANSKAMPMKSGSVADGQSDLGNSSYRWKDLYLSGGAYLGGTGASNKLDDYEEGTWTPAVSSGNFSYGEAWYIKIGNMVHCGANILNFSDRTSNNHVRSSVPFTAASGATATGSMIGRYIDTGTQSTWSPYLGASDASIYFYRNPSDGNYVTLKHSDLNNSAADLHFHITYKTA